MSVRKKEITEEQFNKGNNIVKGVMDAVTKVVRNWIFEIKIH